VSDARAREAEAFAAYRATGDEAARNRLVEGYRGLAVALARRFENRGEPLDDLVQVALIGLLKSVERYDPAHGTAFSTFATPTVLGELKRHFRDKTWSVRVPRGLKDLHVRVAPAVAELHQSFGRSPTIAELSGHLGCSEDDLLEAMEAGAAYRPGSLDAGGPDDGGGPGLSELVSVGDGHEHTDTRVTVRALMAQLPEREREIVYLRYFEDLTQSEIAERIGVSQVHVSRLLRGALERLGRDA
jgi:RNA polymerase sigma-B factor